MLSNFSTNVLHKILRSYVKNLHSRPRHRACAAHKMVFFYFYPDDAFRAGLRKLGPQNNIPEVFLTRKAKKHESRKSPIPYYIKWYACRLFLTLSRVWRVLKPMIRNTKANDVTLVPYMWLGGEADTILGHSQARLEFWQESIRRLQMMNAK